MNWMLPGFNVTTQSININITSNGNIKLPFQGTLYRIDNDNCNPQVIWINQGSPVYPNQKEIDQMNNASNTYPSTIKVSQSNTNSITFDLKIPVYGVALILVPL